MFSLTLEQMGTKELLICVCTWVSARVYFLALSFERAEEQRQPAATSTAALGPGFQKSVSNTRNQSSLEKCLSLVLGHRKSVMSLEHSQ